MSLKTSTLARFPEININALLEAKRKVEEMGPFYRRLKCSPEAYIAIKDYFVEKEHEEDVQRWVLAETKKRKKEPSEIVNSWGTLFGIEIVLDPEQKPGKWEFE